MEPKRADDRVLAEPACTTRATCHADYGHPFRRDAEPGKASADRLAGLPNTSLPTMDHTYLDLLRGVLTHGVERDDRTGTGTLSVFGRMYRHDLADGFPLLPTKETGR